MIQRIQSVYILIVILISVFLFIPGISPVILVKSITSNEFDITLYLSGISTRCISINQPANYISLIIFNCLIILFALFAILKFNHRPLQIKLCYFNALLILMFWGGMYMFANMMMHKTADPKMIFLLGFYLPPVQLILMFLAVKAIKKDEEIVRSADRLR